MIQTVATRQATPADSAIRSTSSLPGKGLALLSLMVLTLALLLGTAVRASAHDISDFWGSYAGSVEVVNSDGEKDLRDLSVVLTRTAKGFVVQWSTVTEKGDGRRKEKAYTVEFIPSERAGIYSAAMQRNVFGHEVQQDPMKGQPYVWARLSHETLTVFSMFIHENGDYEMQQYDRRVTPEGLSLVFTARVNGLPVRQIEADLLRR